MDQPRYEWIINDASLLDFEELKHSVPQQDIKIIRPTSHDESHNELSIVLIIALSAPAITALALWLLRTTSDESIEYGATIRKPDGTEIVVHLKVDRNSSEAPSAQAIKQIAAALQIPEEVIASGAAE